MARGVGKKGRPKSAKKASASKGIKKGRKPKVGAEEEGVQEQEEVPDAFFEAENGVEEPEEPIEDEEEVPIVTESKKSKAKDSPLKGKSPKKTPRGASVKGDNFPKCEEHGADATIYCFKCHQQIDPQCLSDHPGHKMTSAIQAC